MFFVTGGILNWIKNPLMHLNLLDSNIIFYHLNGNKTATEFIRKNINSCAISQITYVEVLSFDFENENERAEVKAFLELISKI